MTRTLLMLYTSYKLAFTVRLIDFMPNMPRKNSKSSKKTQKGFSAITEMVKHSTDQMIGFAKQRYGGKAAAANIARDLTLLKSMLNVEKKRIDSLVGAFNVNSTTPAILFVNAPAEGATNSQRTGDSIKVVRYDALVKFSYGTGTSNTIGNQIFNYYLVRYLKTPSTAGSTPPGIGEMLLVDPDGNLTPLSLVNDDTIENFQFLLQGTIDVRPQYATAPNNNFSLLIPLSHECGFHQTFNNTTAASICDNAVFWIFTAANATNTAGSSTVEYSTRCWYVDN
jgi:hypothetical protein